MIPSLTEDQLDRLDSQAEARVYRLCRDTLPDRVVVLHRIEWIVRQPGSGTTDGEADFVICDTDGAVLVFEVQGGGIAFDPASDTWSSTDGRRQIHQIKDPFRQARSAKYAILGKLKEHRKWPKLHSGKILLGHAVVFPDVDNVQSFETARSPRPIVVGRLDPASFRTWWQDLTEYWRNQDASLSPPGKGVVALIEEIFARPATARKLVAAHLTEEEAVRVRLTAQQARILSILGGRRRVAIRGGAGTGKSLLAVEKAKRLALEGFRTLLLCYNRPLADHLASACNGINGLEVVSFHALCSHRCDLAKVGGRDLIAEAVAAYPGQSFYDVHLPSALAFSADCLPAAYDAVVIDEGQDFRDEYWFAIEMLLSDPDRSPMYIFFDPNQALYTNASGFPIKDEPFTLLTNCRNTQAIHAACYRFYQGLTVEPPEITGLPVETVCAPSLLTQASEIQKLINRLTLEEHVPPEELAVLIVDGKNKENYYAALSARSLTSGIQWSFEDHWTNGAVLVDTVSRFKGLERSAILLWIPEPCDPQSTAALLYVGTSRAKSMLRIVGTEQAVNWQRTTATMPDNVGFARRGNGLP
jgi:hypothetical protein